MAKIKYAENIEPLINKHYGFTFQPHAGGYSMFPEQKNDRKRYPQQWKRQQCNQAAINAWRQASGNVKAAWSDFAADFPEPTKSDPSKFLTGYQLFIKRMFYDYLHEGFEAPIITEPRLQKLDAPAFQIEIADTGLCIDMTEEYITNFGILPEPGQFIILRILPMAIESGQFFEPFAATVEVKEIYYDALICSFDFINPPPGIVFSLYASKPYYESNQYQGTKFRYMGCFKPTTFLKLLDTPNTYTGQKGKIVAVNEEEKALIFIDPPEPIPGTDSDEKVKINAADPAAGYLQDKMKAGENISITPGTGADANKLIVSSEPGAGSYNWNIHSPGQIIGFLPEPSYLNFSTNGSILFETLPAGTFVLTALNENGETTPSAFGEIKVYSDATEQVFSWDAVPGATGYILYKILDAVAVSGLQVDATILEFDLLNPPPHEDLIEPTEPSENTAAIFQSPFTIDNADTVQFTAENAEIETAVSDDDGKIKMLKILVKNSFLELFDTPFSYFSQAKKLLSVAESEDKLIFIDPPPPPFTCADLAECPEFIILREAIKTIVPPLVVDSGESIPPVKYGMLFSGNAYYTGKMFSSSEWDLPTFNQFEILLSAMGGASVANKPLKDTSLVYWPTGPGTNAGLFFGRPAGWRLQDGSFSSFSFYNRILVLNPLWTPSGKNYHRSYNLYHTGTSVSYSVESNALSRGYSFRPCRSVSGVADGTVGVYTCNNGQAIRTVTWSNIEFLADNLSETRYNDNTPIPIINENAAWAADTAGARCAPNGDWSLV